MTITTPDARPFQFELAGFDPDLRHRTNDSVTCLALVARHAEPYELRPRIPPPERHIEATEPGEKVQMDCFYVGRLSGAKGTR